MGPVLVEQTRRPPSPVPMKGILPGNRQIQQETRRGFLAALKLTINGPYSGSIQVPKPGTWIPPMNEVCPLLPTRLKVAVRRLFSGPGKGREKADPECSVAYNEGSTLRL